MGYFNVVIFFRMVRDFVILLCETDIVVWMVAGLACYAVVCLFWSLVLDG